MHLRKGWLVLSVFVAAPALAGAQAVLELPAVAGDAAARGGKSSVEVLSWSWGATNSSAGATGAGKVSVQDLSVMKRSEPAASGKVSVQDLSVTKASPGVAAQPAVADVDGDGAADATAPLPGSVATVQLELSPGSGAAVAELMRGCAKGKHFDSVVLVAGSKRYELSDATFTCAAPAAAPARNAAVATKGELKGHVTLIK